LWRKVLQTNRGQKIKKYGKSYLKILPPIFINDSLGFFNILLKASMISFTASNIALPCCGITTFIACSISWIKKATILDRLSI
jgi:hypothetical protein